MVFITSGNSEGSLMNLAHFYLTKTARIFFLHIEKSPFPSTFSISIFENLISPVFTNFQFQRIPILKMTSPALIQICYVQIGNNKWLWYKNSKENYEHQVFTWFRILNYPYIQGRGFLQQIFIKQWPKITSSRTSLNHSILQLIQAHHSANTRKTHNLSCTLQQPTRFQCTRKTEYF